MRNEKSYHIKIHSARNYQNVGENIVSVKEFMIKFHDSSIN